MYPSSTFHKQKNSSRRRMATVLAVIYLLMVFGPLASLGFHPATSAHAANGECSGDCSICGCSLKSRADNSCCCAKKRQQEHEHDDVGTADCCKKEPAPQKTVIAKCGCPCDSSKTSSLENSLISELIPCQFTENINVPHGNTRHILQTYLVTSRLIEPPDPPPRQS